GDDHIPLPAAKRRVTGRTAMRGMRIVTAAALWGAISVAGSASAESPAAKSASGSAPAANVGAISAPTAKAGSSNAPVVETNSGDAPADSGYTIKGGQDRTDLRALTVE